MNYVSLRTNMVIPLLTKYGKPMTIVRSSAALSGWVKTFDGGLGTWKWTNSTTGAVVYVDPATTVTYLTIPTVGVEKPYAQDEIDGSTIVQGDRRFIVAGDVIPLVGDTLRIDSVTDKVRIQDLKKVSPSTTTVVWIVHARE